MKFKIILMLFFVGLLGSHRSYSLENNGQYETKILFISDSHGLGPYGEKLDELLRTLPNNYTYTYAIGGTAPWQWINPYTRWTSSRGYVDEGPSEVLPRPRNSQTIIKTKTPHLFDLIKKFKTFSGQKVAIISQGTNHQHTEWGLNFLKNNTNSIISKLKAEGFKCLWVGPPRMRRWDNRGENYYQETIDQLLKGVENNCEYFDSSLVTNYPAGGDGIHYATKLPSHRRVAILWAEEVFNTLNELINKGLISQIGRL